jgi:hypothetical protein
LIFFLQDDGQPMTSRCYSATSIWLLCSLLLA